jgi:hypothetical protein
MSPARRYSLRRTDSVLSLERFRIASMLRLGYPGYWPDDDDNGIKEMDRYRLSTCIGVTDGVRPELTFLYAS